METNNNDIEFWKNAIGNPYVRQEVARNSLLAFFNVYCTNDIAHKYELAPFHKEIMGILQDPAHKFFVLEGFRGCSKTSIASRAFALWSIIGIQQVKFLVIIAQTQEQARQYLTNIKKLMLTEPLLSDMGPFDEPEGEWRSNAIDIRNYGARIVVASIEQPIRGLIHGSIRPQVVICDDLENINSARSTDMRDRLFKTFTSDILPLGDLNTRFIIIGTRLHEESLIMKLKQGIENGERDGIFRSYPIVDDEGNSLWPGKYPTKEDVERERRKIANEIAWHREFLLRIIPDDFQVIFEQWLQFYDVLPNKGCRGTYVGVDLAISLKDSADYTAMVVGKLYGEGKDTVLYILPLMVNKRMEFPDTMKMCVGLNVTLKDSSHPKFIVEDVAYQRALPQLLKDEGLDAVGAKVGSTDKRTRLALTAHRIQTGKILFPKQGAEQLIKQLVGFGVVKNDDLADAFSILAMHMIENPPITSSIRWLDSNPEGWREVRTWEDLFSHGWQY